MHLKIISLNLAGFKEWESRLQKIIDFIDEEKPDVLLLQEVQFNPHFSPYTQSIQINRLLQNSFPFTQTTVSKFYLSGSGSVYREGLATMSRFPIADSESLVLTKQPDDKHPRIVQNVDLAVDGRKIGLSNMHLSNNKYSSEQLAEFLGILKLRNETRIIAGDFNIFHLKELSSLYVDKYTSSADFKDYISFPSEGHTLDYALIPHDISFLSLDTREGLSDHNALSFIVKMPE